MTAADIPRMIFSDAFVATVIALIICATIAYLTGDHLTALDLRAAPPRFIPIAEFLKDQPGDTYDRSVVILRGGYVEIGERPKWTELAL